MDNNYLSNIVTRPKYLEK